MKEQFSEALQGKKIPILTLDNKWYKLLDVDSRKAVSGLEDRLNSLLMRQGKLNTEIKEIKRFKKKLMSEIVIMADEAAQKEDSEIQKEIDQHKKLVEESNRQLADDQDELLEIPGKIEQVNYELMLLTMERCYDAMKKNRGEIEEIAEWVTDIRIELKKRLIRKQEMEQQNSRIYSYMHDIFGMEVVDIFDMKYDP